LQEHSQAHTFLVISDEIQEQKKDNRIELLRERLDNILDRKHELVTLTELINWEFFENKRGSYYKGNYG